MRRAVCWTLEAVTWLLLELADLLPFEGASYRIYRCACWLSVRAMKVYPSGYVRWDDLKREWVRFESSD